MKVYGYNASMYIHLALNWHFDIIFLTMAISCMVWKSSLTETNVQVRSFFSVIGLAISHTHTD